MNFFQSVASLPLGWLIAAVVVILGASLLVLWISIFIGRRWAVAMRKSEEKEVTNIYLSRIAEAVERLAGTSEAKIGLVEARAPRLEPAPRKNTPSSAKMSMFGL